MSTWKTAADQARVFYRFRPKPSVRESLGTGERDKGTLTLEDYAWEIKGGGNPAIDLTEIEWDDDDVGETVRFSDLPRPIHGGRRLSVDFMRARVGVRRLAAPGFEVGSVGVWG